MQVLPWLQYSRNKLYRHLFLLYFRQEYHSHHLYIMWLYLFHQFSGLSTPVLMWFSSYHKPYTVTSGFLTVVKNKIKTEDALQFDIKSTAKKPVVIVCMPENEKYTIKTSGRITVKDGVYTIQFDTPVEETITIIKTWQNLNPHNLLKQMAWQSLLSSLWFLRRQENRPLCFGPLCFCAVRMVLPKEKRSTKADRPFLERMKLVCVRRQENRPRVSSRVQMSGTCQECKQRRSLCAKLLVLCVFVWFSKCLKSHQIQTYFVLV